MGAKLFEQAEMMATIIRVHDVAASVEWYRDKLDLDPVHVGSDGPDHPIAAFAIAGSVISLWQLPPDARRRRDDADESTYVVAVMKGDLEPQRRALESRGVEVGELRRSANNEFFWFYDPDGNRFEVSRPITAEFREAAARVATGS
jgi:catechol 2,3-dioxygenase-like lactoylglutathione lyase family enzyme